MSLVLMIRLDLATLESKFDDLRRELWTLGYVPQVRQEKGESLIEIVRRPVRTPWSSLANVVFLIATFATLTVAGALLWVAYEGQATLTGSDVLYGGVFFAVPLVAILGCHELAHYVMSKRHNVEASLPFFMPMPPPFFPFGTLGAFISLREPIPDKKALLDIGASGPIAGFLVALPVTVAGFALSLHSPVLSPTNCGPVFISVPYGDLVLGTSGLWYAFSLFLPPTLINLNPLAIAGWVGLFVTAINLLPAGQLDGGHVFRALLGPRSFYVSMAAVVLLLGAGLLYSGWLIFAVLIIFLGLRHPPPLNDITPLDMKRKIIGGLAVAILITGFVLVPITTPTGDFSVNGAVTTTPMVNTTGTHANLTFTIDNQDIVGHVYLLNGSLEPFGISDGRFVPLTGAALRAYLANLTWTLSFRGPSGNAQTQTFHGGTFDQSAPGDPIYVNIPNALGSDNVNVQVSDPQAATFNAWVGVFTICSVVQDAPGVSGTTTFSDFP